MIAPPRRILRPRSLNDLTRHESSSDHRQARRPQRQPHPAAPFRSPRTAHVTTKQRSDFVSEADVQAEREIIQILRKTYPSHGIVAEESGEQPGQDEYQWIIDPLDGTTNFLHGIPHFAISIAFRHKNRLEAALVYDPIREEMFICFARRERTTE
jgi:fructose-1,6-bisphosphatase/inositol monophosphatase family enzyme